MNDPRVDPNIGDRLSVIVWHPVIEPILEIDPPMRALLQRPTIRVFPDGSVCLDTSKDLWDFWPKLEAYRKAGLMVRQNTIIRSLACFPRRDYQFITPWQYFDRIGGEQDLIISPGPWTDDVFVHEGHPEELLGQAVFWRKPAKSNIDSLLNALREWAGSVRSEGVFKDGPARLLDNSWRQIGKRYEFKVDLHNSGQDTLNWLILSILNFAALHSPISEIRFANYHPLPRVTLTPEMKRTIKRMIAAEEKPLDSLEVEGLDGSSEPE